MIEAGWAAQSSETVAAAGMPAADREIAAGLDYVDGPARMSTPPKDIRRRAGTRSGVIHATATDRGTVARPVHTVVAG
ncbi:hypothetical protein [Kutzneria chonburiensis]|uniref:Uncharacterized protein n=1 Tax=Kutzneria chonburiensis TaxID=1483604 RepID=A0ABV6MRS1_9PSEU|nr:hypothetical protein [Kutzneria chonburiensis]